ncbi:MAG: Rieske 2Fe-2S domain-containing protein [Proteobacteria bacterium]|nr:Rieske 2Fe-2S domain-containing protein [Pseudomonadota bacterium]MDE3208957.1 Rieske 2Fe-2S domain-containing protein [Pseudomonadota bacterium]
MAYAKRLICDSDQVLEQGKGFRFEIEVDGEVLSAFIIRYEGRPRGYVNRCAHVPVELDWQEGDFFDSSGQYLICSTHGAIYAPESGYCLGGPCGGKRLVPLKVVEEDNHIMLLDAPLIELF